jgi:hypothetical protein
MIGHYVAESVRLSSSPVHARVVAFHSAHFELFFTWPQLDCESDTIALEPDETKNREGRSVPI